MSKLSVKKQITMSVVDISQGLQSIHVVGTPVAADISAAWVEVGLGNIVRVVVGANVYFSFADVNTGGAVDAATDPGVMIVSGEHYIVASGKFIRASANPTRVEILSV